jgi:membrane fusion protein (multidrug efflux system)
VSGFLEKRLFEEGATVEAGEVLFLIEKDAYIAAVNETKGAIARAEAELELANIEVSRSTQLVQRQAAPQSRLDEAIAKQGAARGELQQLKAALDKAELDLSYTEIVAPINGKIGRAAYTVGNYVRPESGTLATIVSQDPIYVTFPVSARELLAARERAKASGGDPTSLPVKVRLPDGRVYDQTGQLDFIDVQVDRATDTATVRARLANLDGYLIDGQFVGVIVEAEKPQPSLVVPQAGLITDQAGAFVLVVGAGGKLERRSVRVARLDKLDAVIAEGLKEGEKVVVEGIQRVRPGMAVQTTEVARPAGA